MYNIYKCSGTRAQVKFECLTFPQELTCAFRSRWRRDTSRFWKRICPRCSSDEDPTRNSLVTSATSPQVRQNDTCLLMTIPSESSPLQETFCLVCSAYIAGLYQFPLSTPGAPPSRPTLYDSFHDIWFIKLRIVYYIRQLVGCTQIQKCKTPQSNAPVVGIQDRDYSAAFLILHTQRM